MNSIEITLLEAVRRSNLSLAELARRAKLPYASVHGFVKSDRQITIRSAAALAKVVKLELKRKAR